MITCKNCGTPIEKTLRHCPICHHDNPTYKELDSTGKDITDTYDPVASGYVLIKQKKRKTAMILALLLGFTGLSFYYLHFYRKGYIWLMINGLLSAIIIAFTVYQWPYHLVVIIIAGLIIGLMQLSLTLFIALKSELKDGLGEFLK